MGLSGCGPTLEPMSTPAYTFPVLEPPFDDWDADWTGNGGDPDEGTAYATFTVRATSVEEAEKRIVSWVDYNFEDDLRGAIATGVETAPGHFTVRVLFARPRG